MRPGSQSDGRRLRTRGPEMTSPGVLVTHIGHCHSFEGPNRLTGVTLRAKGARILGAPRLGTTVREARYEYAAT